MGGEIDWSALPIVCEHLGISDPGRLIDQLAVIRQHFRDKD